MNRFQQFGEWRLTFAFDVMDLPADHSTHRARRCGKLRSQCDAPFGGYSLNFASTSNARVTGIAGQNRHRFAEDLVTCRPAPSQIVVVESRKIIVDQRVGVDQFERTGDIFHTFDVVRHFLAPRMHSTGRIRLPPANRL